MFGSRKLTAIVIVPLMLLAAHAVADELLLGNQLYWPESGFGGSADDSAHKCCCPRLTCPKPCPIASCGLGEPWTLMNLCCCPPPISIGGWQQVGYTEQSTGLFNTNPDQVNLHQSWLYAEKSTDTSERDWDWGFRADVMYGTDADDTQAFGNDPGEWDFLNGFDHGIYGWAIPQLYAELAYKDLSVTVGHFYTIMGYEVVTAPDNFFFSHAYTMYNSEPFTHTGVLTSYAVDDRLTLYNGWTLGWDTGFDQSNQGNNYLGGVSVTPCDTFTFIYTASAGNLGARGGSAYTHSIVMDVTITGRLNYVFQSDLVRVGSTGEDNLGVNQYLFYQLNDLVSLGTRVEWWKADDVTGFDYDGQIAAPTSSSSYHAATFGLNVRPHPNLVFRPEFRYDWAPFANYEESIFAIDIVLTY